MEKFARHALIDGVADVRGLTVGRESELFRALNMHYNKANDFKVTDTARYNSCSSAERFYHSANVDVLLFSLRSLYSQCDHVHDLLLYFIFLDINTKA